MPKHSIREEGLCDCGQVAYRVKRGKELICRRCDYLESFVPLHIMQDGQVRTSSAVLAQSNHHASGVVIHQTRHDFTLFHRPEHFALEQSRMLASAFNGGNSVNSGRYS